MDWVSTMSHITSFSRKHFTSSILALSITFLPTAFADTYDGNRDTNNRFHGTGTYTYLSGGSYEGQWKHGQKSGQGKRTWADGSVYEGQWENNSAQGKGTKTFSDGSQYSGNFINGERSGHGTMKWRNGEVYTGQWKNDQPNGEGTKHFSNGASYSGHFEMGKQSGEGKYIYPDNSYYQGAWKNNASHGHGSLTFVSGDKYVGNFVQGQPDGFGEFFYTNGDRYTGQWKNGKRTGKGSLKFQAGGSYEGYFKQGKKSGYGILLTALGDEYVGPFENDMAHGKGTCKTHNKKSDCEYKFGQKISSGAISFGASNVAAIVKPETPSTPPASVVEVSAVISSAPIVAAKDVFKDTIKKDIKKLTKTYTLADIPQNTSNVLFSHDFNMDLMSMPELSLWKKRSALFSNAVRIESRHGTVHIVIQLDNYRGPGVYTIDDDNVTVTHKGKAVYEASEAKPSTITIKSDDNRWISGTFNLALFNGNQNKAAHTINNGVFRLSQDVKNGYRNW